jgi:flagellar protein FliO/FliZ
MQEIGWPGLLSAALALAGVLGALALVLRGLRAAGLGRAEGKRIGVVEAVALDGRRRLLLLRCDGREMLVMTGGPQDVALGWLPEKAP